MKWPKSIAVSLSISAFLFTAAALTNPSQTLAATYTVTKTADTNDGTCDADCSLREAIAAANANAGHDTIEFDMPTSDAGHVPPSGNVHGYWALNVPSGHLILSDDAGVFINGYSQIGSSRNSAPFGETMNTVLTVEVNFTGNWYFSLTGGNNHLAGLAANAVSTANTMSINGSKDNWIEGNILGGDITGQNSKNTGKIHLLNGATGNIIGTNGDGVGDVGERNLVMGNSTHAKIDNAAENNVIAGNYIGVNSTGRVCGGSLVYRGTVSFSQASGGRLGTNFDGISDSEEPNIVACVTTDARGVLRMSGGSNIVIQGNYIGTNPHGDTLTDFEIPGVIFRDTTSFSVLFKGNTVGNNNGVGIVVRNNSPQPLGLTFSNNKIAGNTGIPLDLAEDGVTPNDPSDTDTGPNDLMNYPEIQGAEYLGNGRYKIWGWLEGNLSEAPFTIEVCKSSNHPSGHGGCLESLGTMTTSERMWSMEVTVPGDSEGSLSTFTALATNKNGSTSEFGPNFGGSIPGPGAPAPTPKKPDLLALHSGFIQRQDVLSFAPPATFLWDVYLDVSYTPQAGTKRISGAYWQTSGIYSVWYKSFFNDAKILPEVISSPFLLAFRYDPTKLEPNLPEGNLRLAYSEDGEVWKVLSNSVLDMVNKTVAVVTKQGGYYMLVSGYPF